ncbi:MAG: ATP-binding cassette domain-containing protein [Treponema sp.]|jgi:ABC-2 type transport system ATP-binding protein|nr:ATP-binding cassette domain-containing protein [Treponema sp.]
MKRRFLSARVQVNAASGLFTYFLFFDILIRTMIEVHKLCKRYGPFAAVKDVSFSVGTGQVLGFLGPNGAGKTTVMKILTGYHFPTNGEARIDGISVQDEPVEVKKRIGYLPESVPLYGDLTVDEYLSFAARARLLSRNEAGSAVKRSAAACGLEPVFSRRIEALSKGYRQRVGLAQAIIHDPPILILDEPTSGLDPNQIIEIRSLIKELGKRKTVILSTHILQEVEAVCSQVLIINEGRIAAQGNPDEIALSMKSGDTWDLILKGPGLKAAADLEEKLARLGKISAVSIAVPQEGVFRLGFSIPVPENTVGLSADQGERIFDWAVGEGLKILGMNRKKLSMEDIFVALTNEAGGEQ